MTEQTSIKARVKFSPQSERKVAIGDGYRPGLKFEGFGMVSGHFDMDHRDVLRPGETRIIRIHFVSDDLRKAVKRGYKFNFFEGPNLIGIGTVLEIESKR